MNPRCLASCTLAAIVASCAACQRVAPSTQPRAAAAPLQASAATPVTGVIVSAQPGGALAAQAPSPGNQPQPIAATTPAKLQAIEASSRPLSDTEVRLGPWTLAQGQDFSVTVHSKRLEEQPGKFNEAAAWLEIRDAAGAVQYREVYSFTVEHGMFNEQCSAGAEFLAGSNGKGILISSECLPSAPGGGGPYRLLGLVSGKLIPIGKNLYLEGDMHRFVPGAITKQGTATRIEADMLEFKVFTGNFSVLLPLRVNWMQGKLEPGMRCYEQTGHGFAESGCEVPVVDTQRSPGDQEMTFVRLFSEAHEGLIPAHVVVRRNSKVEIIAAKVQAVLSDDQNNMSLGVADDVWLKVRVDGKEGWIHGQEDFLAIGLPQAG